ncbi:MAG: tRNA glutamyl-Q(34) synthetase GluQRS [Rhodospirillales bacterium]|nr:tRNA glutamyl-Q(34) synthetase GluQRS [Rhodospirillales bacterium]
MSTVTRFAPSPTGYLHLGHAYSALFAARFTTGHGERFLVRIEDIDPERCRPEFEQAIMDDLAWLGLTWEVPVRRQSEHMADYAAALDVLDGLGLLYPCFCTRADIRREIEAAGYAPHDAPSGPDGPIYPGTCREINPSERHDRLSSGEAYALRLDMTKAIGQAIEQAGTLTWCDHERGEQITTPEIFGDVVLARKDTPTSYHLAVTVDDHLQGITLVTRGEDLFSASHIHRLLQALLGYETPDYHHHALLSGDDGKRFAKRDKAATLHDLRQSGVAAIDIIRKLGIAG